MPNETQLLKDSLGGDLRAFRKLIDLYKNLIGKMVYRMISRPEDRQEVAQDVYLAIHQRLDSFRGDSQLSTWIARIAYYKCVDYYKKKDKNRVFESFDSLSDQEILNQHRVEDSPEERLILKQEKEQIAECINRLPSHYKLVLSLFHFDNLTYTEIGKILKMPDGTVKSHLFRARRLMRKLLESTSSNFDL